MATCQNCGAEVSGQYCDTCGARVQEERAPKKPKKDTARVSVPARPLNALAPQRVWRSTVYIVLGAVLFFGGMLSGFYLSGNAGGSGALTSTSTDATSSSGDASIDALTPLGQAGALMEQGVDAMSKGDRSGAVKLFRESIDKYQGVLKDEPNNLYARSYMGLTYYYAGDSKNAVENLKLALKTDPNYLWALFNLAWIYETGNKPAEALTHYKKYLEVVDKEKEDQMKYAEQYELIPQQTDAAKAAVEKLGGGTKQ